MSSIWCNGIEIAVFGESHSTAVGIVIDHLPAGKFIDLQQLQQFMRRRQAKSDGTTTSRIEPDIPEILSGLYNNKTTGTPLCFFIRNTNTRSEDYKNLSNTIRPGHADYTGALRYDHANDQRGGGHFSGRLTAPLVAAGAVCGQILQQYGVSAVAFLHSLHHLTAPYPPDFLAMSPQQMQTIRELPFPVLDPKTQQDMITLIQETRMKRDSIGGVIQCVAIGMPAGIGSPLFSGLESLLAQLIFAVPGVKGVEFGQGFNSTLQYGSEHNDPFYYDSENPPQIKTSTNHHGGILGGISSGMPICFKVAMKPTASIALQQNSVDLSTLSSTKLNIVGRHDPCIAVRAVPVIEACCNIALLGSIISQKGLCL